MPVSARHLFLGGVNRRGSLALRLPGSGARNHQVFRVRRDRVSCRTSRCPLLVRKNHRFQLLLSSGLNFGWKSPAHIRDCLVHSLPAGMDPG
jgi:hypothetical protein